MSSILDQAIDALTGAGCVAPENRKLAAAVLSGYFAAASSASGGAGAGAGAGAGSSSKRKSRSNEPKLATKIMLFRGKPKEGLEPMLVPLIANPDGDGKTVDLVYMANLNGRPLSDPNKRAFKIGTDESFEKELAPGLYGYDDIMNLYKAWSDDEKASAWKVMAPIVRCMAAWTGPKSTLKDVLGEVEGLERIVVTAEDVDDE